MNGQNGKGPDEAVAPIYRHGLEQGHLVGRRSRLRPVRSYDYEFLYSLATTDPTAYRWRYHGFVPNYDVFVQQLWTDVLVQFVITSRQEKKRHGIVVAYSPDLRNGHVRIAQAMVPELVGTGAAIEPASLFLEYLFSTWNFRKIYGEAPSFNDESVRSGRDVLFKEEGVLRDHIFLAGRYWDQHITALYRQDWERLGQRYLARIQSRPEWLDGQLADTDEGGSR